MAKHLGDPFGEFLPRQRVVVKETERAIDGEGVVFWHAFALNLKAGVKELVEDRDEAIRIAIERKAIDAGLRAVIRVALAEIRKSNPNSPLLNKANRDRVFKEFEEQEMQRILNMRGEEKWKPELSEKTHSSE